MLLFQSAKPEWSRLACAVPLEDGGWRLPDHIPLATLLELKHPRHGQLEATNTAALRLSTRPTNVLSDQNIASVSELLELTLAELMALPGMGYGSAVEIFNTLLAFAHAPAVVGGWAAPPLAEPQSFAEPQLLKPLTLLHEWELFGGSPSCATSVPLTDLALSEDVRHCLEKLGFACLHDLLDQTYFHLCEAVGEEGAEEAANAVVVLAAEARHRHGEWVLPRDGSTERTALLADRWGEVSVASLDLSGEAERALRRTQVTTISELLAVLEPLHVELALDLYAFAMLWTSLQAIGLREEAWQDAGERLSAEAYNRTSLDHVSKAWQGFITPRIWAVGAARYGLESWRTALETCEEGTAAPWCMPTLEELGTRFGVTRERVRQMELRFIKNLIRRQDDYFLALQNTLLMITSQAGGVLSLGQAAEELSEWINPGGVAQEGVCRLILNNSSAFVSIKKNAIYAKVEEPHRFYNTIISTARKYASANSDGLSISDLAKSVTSVLFPSTPDAASDKELPTVEFILACLRADGSFETRLKRPANDQAGSLLIRTLIQVIGKLGSPRHYSEIAAKFNESELRKAPVTAHYIHKQLVHYRDLFVCVASGTYGLAEWGMEDQRTGGHEGEAIGNIMTEYLDSHGTPATKEDITAYVLARKSCRVTSVMQSLLYDARFHRFDKNKFGLSKWTF